jgi:gamma-glutamyltranspeptidase/glutathione hydrolase
MGTHGVVTAGHYLASTIGLQILTRGGNAIDAGVAMGFALSVLEPQSNGIAGEAPLLIYSADKRRVFAINGQGTAPKAATIAWFKAHEIDVIPGDGLLPATVPAAFDAWVTALERFGTLSLGEVLTPAIELAENGFPMYERMRTVLLRVAERFREEWPTSAEIYLPKGEVPDIGDILILRDWAETFKTVVEEERRALRQGRAAALKAARDRFYKGEIAETIDRFVRENRVLDASGRQHSGLLRKEDLAGYHARVEEPVTTSYRGYHVYKCGPWCQGPVFLQQLNLLEGFDLASMGHNTVEYIHTVIEAAKLAFADRETYYADPEFVAVPLEKLLSKDYATERRTLIDPDTASMELRPGDTAPIVLRESEPGSELHVGDTTHLDVIDRYGNMMSATPSGGWIRSSPVVEGLGFPLGTRGQMFHLDPNHAEALMPGRRPSTTLTPSLVLKNNKPFMVFGTPGGDRQDQWTLQFFLNFVDFQMDIQEAIDAPTFHSLHFPGSFYPHDAHPGLVAIEGRIPEAVRRRLAEKGHRIQIDGEWSHGRVLAVRLDQERGVICGAASPRAKMAYSVGW